MAVLNNIRKQSIVLIAVIALALFSFVLADLFRNSDALTSKSQNIVATINGKDIKRESFMQKVEVASRQSGANSTNTQVMNRVWDQEVRLAVMESQYEAIGFTVEKDQMRDLLKTNLTSTPEFLNEAGLFDENKLNEFIANLKALSPQAGVLGGQPITYASWVNFENNISVNGLQQNYNDMVKAGMIGTLEEGKLEYKLGEDKVDIKFVQVPFSTIPDSTITVSKAEISSYIKANRKSYEVDESRDISYVQFNEVASIEDENNIKETLSALLNDRVEYNDVTSSTDSILGFGKVVDNETFINSNSDIKYDNRFVYKSSLAASAIADTIFNLYEGGVYGPYKENNHFKISKIVAVRQMPDSVKARHILIPFIGSNSASAETTQTEQQAKVTADSIMSVVKTDPLKFIDLLDFSADKASNEKEGVLDWFVYRTMVPEFRDFAFENSIGDVGVVKSPFGFHIIEILGQKNIQKTIKLGTIARVIEPSEATIDKVFRDASNFEIAIAKSNVQEVAKEDNYTVRPVNGIKILDENIPGLGNQRAIVRWSFNSDNKVGDYKRFDVPGGYAIVQLVAKNEEGLMSTEDASVTALPEIRKEKKAKLIEDRVTATTLEDFATAESQTVKSALAVNMKSSTISGAGNEPLIVGTAFGLEEGEVSKLVVGTNGVYMVQVTKVTSANDLANYQSYANQVGTTKINAVNTRLYNALKEAATIEDNRAKTVQ